MKTLLTAAALLLTAGAAHAQDAKVTFDFQTSHSAGTIRVALFNSAQAYGGGAPVAQQMATVSSTSTAVVFEGLPPGDYAMRSFHDWDDDGEMDTNPFGMPTEPYAFSNNARGNMGPASWDRASFRVEGDVIQSIDLR
jgi:uncharacterized protein (DUF2141 family)